MKEATVEIVESRLDWVTATVKPGDKEPRFRLYGQSLLAGEVKAGNRRKAFGMHGYRGEHAGRATVGDRDDGSIIQVQGELADAEFRHLHRLADHVSRVDLCVTVRITPFTTMVAHQLLEEYRADERREGIRAHSWLIDHEPSGSTCYIGERSGNLHSRCYNKEAQSQDPKYAQCWRYELEVKGDLAPNLADHCASLADWSSFVADHLHDYYTQRGCQPLWNRGCVPGRHFGEPVTTDATRQLRWLRESVSATLAQLVAWGYGQEVRDALRLDVLLDPSYVSAQAGKARKTTSATRKTDPLTTTGQSGTVGPAGALGPVSPSTARGNSDTPQRTPR